MNAFSIDNQRLLVAALAVLMYVAMCLIIAYRQWRKRRDTKKLSDPATATSTASTWQIVYASQTGTAEELAQQTASTLHLAGLPVRLCALSELDAHALANAGRILFIVSTYGEGDAPDNAALFATHTMSQTIALGHVHYAMLALGDRNYAHFCGFGRTLDAWLQAQGAQPLFPSLEAHQYDAAAIDTWRNQLSHIAGTDDAPDWQGPNYDDWRLVERRQLNPGSAGEGIFHLEFEPADGFLPLWESGDLAQIVVPSDPERPREYSIASIVDDGRVHLLVRLHRHADGSFGAASHWLTQAMQIGDTVSLRVRRHERFRLGSNTARPLILIGNGSGIAGLRAHLKARAMSGGSPAWLIFGERNAACDYHYQPEIADWLRTGTLGKLDAVFSRDQAETRYVQHRLLECRDAVREWIERGAAIYVCGSLRGMAAGVDAALTDILGEAALEALSAAGRYRRDVY